MHFIVKLFRMILLFWMGAIALLIMTMFAANLALSHA
jgi:hypothetical protein